MCVGVSKVTRGVSKFERGPWVPNLNFLSKCGVTTMLAKKPRLAHISDQNCFSEMENAKERKKYCILFKN